MSHRRNSSPFAIDVDWVEDGRIAPSFDEVTPPRPLSAERVAELLGQDGADEDEEPADEYRDRSAVTAIGQQRSDAGLIDPRVERATAAYQRGEFVPALTLCEAVLKDDPSNVDARLYAVSCREILSDGLLTRLGGPRRVPYPIASPRDLHETSLDPRSAFLLSLIDGYYSLEEIADMSGWFPHEAYRVIEQLKSRGVIGLD